VVRFPLTPRQNIMFEAWAQQHGHYLHSRTTLYIHLAKS